jgi:hypothetical protein
MGLFRSARATFVGSLLLPLLLANCSKDASNTPVTPPRDGAIAGQVVRTVNSVQSGHAGVTVAVSGGPSTVTDAGGNFRLGLPAGTYTVTFSAPAYEPRTSTNVEVTSGNDHTFHGTWLQLAPPQLLAEEIRIQLTWTTNRDLDAYLSTPLHDHPGAPPRRFLVYWEWPGNIAASPFARLDHDHETPPGPETIAISRSVAGVYRYAVHDYSAGTSTSSTTLSRSGARVRVMRGQQQLAEFNVPNQGGTLWTVFDMNVATGAITPVNAMSFQQPTLQNLSPATSTSHADAPLVGTAGAARPKR